MLHYALPIGVHLKGQVNDCHCVRCQVQDETLKHLFWTNNCVVLYVLGLGLRTMMIMIKINIV